MPGYKDDGGDKRWRGRRTTAALGLSSLILVPTLAGCGNSSTTTIILNCDQPKKMIVAYNQDPGTGTADTDFSLSFQETHSAAVAYVDAKGGKYSTGSDVSTYKAYAPGQKIADIADGDAEVVAGKPVGGKWADAATAVTAACYEAGDPLDNSSKNFTKVTWQSQQGSGPI